MLLAAFIATIAASPMFWFKSKGMSNGLALGSVVLGIFLALGLIAALLTQSTSAFSAKLPFYQERLAVLQSDVIALLQAGIFHWMPRFSPMRFHWALCSPSPLAHCAVWVPC